MPVYFEATLIAASLTAAVSVSAQPMLAVSTADWPTDTNCHMVKKPQRMSHRPSSPEG